MKNQNIPSVKLSRHSSGEFLVWVLIFCLLTGLARPVTAATLPIADIVVGKVVSINGQQFVKIGTDPVKGSQFMALAPMVTPGFAEGMEMDDFTATMCNDAPTPAATEYFLIGNLQDSRDGKTYEVRKFADGKCWMVDNLKYGGPTDACASKTSFAGGGSATPTNRFGTGTYGDCRNNPGDASYGYLYNWQAAMQHPSAYINTTYTGPTTNVQGLCPAGWHLPAGKATGEFATLDKANGGTGATQSPCTSASCNFWRPGYGYKGVYSGYSGSSGSLGGQGSGLTLWSASEFSVTSAWDFNVGSSNVYPGSGNNDKNGGFAVRCVKDTTDRTMQSFTTADCATYPTPAANGYTLVGSLKDERDGKWYEVRKFADGKCWMADNLAYGGVTDACASKTTFSGNGSATPTNTFGTGTYGDCRNNPGDTSYGYLYNWQAAMQHSSAYYNSTYTGPTTNVQGICPSGWHLPSGNTGGEFSNLDIANGGTGAYQPSCTSASCNFWRPGYNYKGVYSGNSDSSGSLYNQGSGLYLWSASESSVTRAWDLGVGSSYVYPGSNYSGKSYGFAVRCIKN